MQYSLTDYVLSITSPVNGINAISIGGQGTMLGSISVNMEKTLFSVKGYSTGGYVHDKSYDRTGTIQLALNQLSDQVQRLIRLVNCYYGDEHLDGCTISITDKDGDSVCSAKDCYPSKYADASFGAEAEDQTWEFTCGEISLKEKQGM